MSSGKVLGHLAEEKEGDLEQLVGQPERGDVGSRQAWAGPGLLHAAQGPLWLAAGALSPRAQNNRGSPPRCIYRRWESLLPVLTLGGALPPWAFPNTKGSAR